jgi:SOS-response transcriptional repressor LexA
MSAHQTTERVYDYIETYIRNTGRPPTYRDIMDGLPLSSVSVVAHHLHILSDEGRIERIIGKARSIVIPGLNDDERLLDLAWNVVDAWEGGGLGDAIRALQTHLNRVAPRT